MGGAGDVHGVKSFSAYKPPRRILERQVTPEEILALRRQVARQLERRSTLERTRKGARRWAEEARLAERLVIE